MMDNELANTVAMVGIIAALVQQSKRVKWFVDLQEKIPIFVMISIALGVGAAYYIGAPNAIVEGVIMGLTACGAYSATKTQNGSSVARPPEALP
jgi:hypothetical protein